MVWQAAELLLLFRPFLCGVRCFSALQSADKIGIVRKNEQISSCKSGQRRETELDLKEQNRKYWEKRAEGYSEVNKEELAGVQRVNWTEFLCRQIKDSFPDRTPQLIRILDIGAGPGFLSIILAEQGFSVTAVDRAENMLHEARHNAGELADRIEFVLADAEDLPFSNGSFDVVLSRNLTWNLPDPEKAYRSWLKVLKPGGLMLVFDANWYRYLVSEDTRNAYDRDRDEVQKQGFEDYNIGDDFDVMEKIAGELPLTDRVRPAWDAAVLEKLGVRSVETAEDVGQQLYSRKELVNYSATPLFMVKAIR